MTIMLKREFCGKVFLSPLIFLALEVIPNSIVLWKEAISLEESPQEAKILLSRAVELIPLCIDFWLTLARLETYDKARIVINNARKAIPTSHEVWIAAARLEEQNGEHEKVDTIISRGISVLSQKGAILSRNDWIKQAEECEKNESPITCQAIIRATIGINVEDDDRKSTWYEDIDDCISRGFIETARAIFSHALKTFPEKKGVWKRAAFFEKEHGNNDALFQILEKSVEYCPHAEILWLMRAKETWLNGDVDGARKILVNAFSSNPDNEQIWLAAVKLESENGEYERAKTLLQNAREKAATERIWMKSAVLERLLNNNDRALEILDEATEKFPEFDKLWMIKGQIYNDDKQDLAQARTQYAKGLKHNPKSIPLWLLSSRLEESQNLIVKSRSLIEKARLANPKTPILWLEAVKIESRSGNVSAAKNLLSKAIQECPTSGLLWAEAIFLESKPQRRSKSMDALNKCSDDPHVVCSIAQLFWLEKKIDKARSWFERAVKIDKDFGDAWAYWYKFELEFDTPDLVQGVVDKYLIADPHHGEVWQSISKNPKNSRIKGEDLLQLVSNSLE